jgi:hypothetical protein
MSLEGKTPAQEAGMDVKVWKELLERTTKTKN